MRPTNCDANLIRSRIQRTATELQIRKIREPNTDDAIPPEGSPYLPRI